MADIPDYRGNSPGRSPDPPLSPGDAPRHTPRLTFLSYSVIVLMAVLWPILSFILGGFQLESARELGNPIVEIYLPTIVIQLFVLGMVVLALRSEEGAPSTIGLAGFNRWTPLAGISFLIAANIMLLTIQTFILSQSPDSLSDITPLLPQTLMQRLVWALLCVVVAVSEEITFRGYLITRVATLAGGRRWVGVVVATMAFASGHIYQGLGGFVLIFIYGLMFSALFLKTRSLFPGMIAHFLQDIAAMFLAS